MADAWETLISNSTLPDPGHDAWEHLNAQGGGTGFVLIDTVEIELMEEVTDIEIVESAMDIEIVENPVDIEVVEEPIEIEVS